MLTCSLIFRLLQQVTVMLIVALRVLESEAFVKDVISISLHLVALCMSQTLIEDDDV